MKIYVKPEYKEIVNTLEELAVSRRLKDVFDDWVELMAISIQNQFITSNKFFDNKKRFTDIQNKYTEKEMDTLTLCFRKLASLHREKPFRDVLGEIYVNLRINNRSLDQIFTPYHISSFMAKTTIDIEVVKKNVKEKGVFAVADYASGSGVNIVAACEYLYKNNIYYCSNMLGLCQEIDKIPALMSYVTLSLIGCPAIIKIGNYLKDPLVSYSEEIKKGSDIWTTPAFNENILETMLGLICN